MAAGVCYAWPMARDRENIGRFDELAAEWDDKPLHVETGAAIATAMLAALRLRGDERALEFGAGTGLVTLHVAPHCCSLVAMDGSSGMLGVLRRKCAALALENVTPREGMVPADLPPGPFELIFSSLTLHHIENLPALFAALFHCLAPGGRVAFADLEAEDGSFHGDAPGISHHGFARPPLRALLQGAGFGDVQFSPAHVIRRTGDCGEQRDYPLFLVVAAKPA